MNKIGKLREKNSLCLSVGNTSKDDFRKWREKFQKNVWLKMSQRKLEKKLTQSLGQGWGCDLFTMNG